MDLYATYLLCDFLMAEHLSLAGRKAVREPVPTENMDEDQTFQRPC